MECMGQSLFHSYECSGYYRYFFDINGNVLKVKWAGNSSKKTVHQQSLLKQVYDRLHKEDIQMSCNFIDCFTVLRVYPTSCDDLCKNTDCHLFRADPYFHRKVWFDWCITKWEGFEESFPSRIFLFIDPTNMEFDTIDVTERIGKYWAIVKSSTIDSRTGRVIRGRRQPHYTTSSPILQSFELENRIRMINCDSIERPVFVNPNISSQNTREEVNGNSFNVKHIITMPPFSEWGQLWTS